MSCCISSAVCCVLITSSMSGVALGYNYSLAEYIDLKETNVSVYLKRGVFDDEITDELDWRRRGESMPLRGHVRDDGLVTGEPEGPEEMPRGGRRLDDTILESDDQNKFEGSLMRLTAGKPPYQETTTSPVTSDFKMDEIVSNYPQGSLDQLKAIQSLINMRKSSAARDPNVKKSTYGYDENMLPHLYNPTENTVYIRRMMGNNDGPLRPGDLDNSEMATLNPARLAVPDARLNERGNWLAPKLPPEVYISHPTQHFDYEAKRTFPGPVPVSMGPIRPTRPPTERPTPTVTVKPPQMKELPDRDRSDDEGLDTFKDNMMLNKISMPRVKGDKIKPQDGGWKKTEIDYDDEDLKGLPVRKKRSYDVKLETAPKEIHHKSNPREEAVQYKLGGNSNNIFNEITNHPNNFVRKLLLSNKPLSNEASLLNENEKNTEGKTFRRSNDRINFDATTDRVVKMIRSMFST